MTPGHPAEAHRHRIRASTVTSDAHRFAGIDTRTVKPALLVLALAVLMSVVLPSIDSETSYSDGVQTGDIVAIADGVTLVPTPGWELASGALVGQTRSPIGSTTTTQLVDGSVKFAVQAAPFDGPPSALLGRLNEISSDLDPARGTTRRYPVTTRQGADGVAEDFVGASGQGTVVALVFSTDGQPSEAEGQPTREGVGIVVSGPKDQVARRRDDIVAMIRSLRTAP